MRLLHENRIILLLFWTAVLSSQLLGYFTVLSRLRENFLVLSIATIIGSAASLLCTILTCVYISSSRAPWLVLAWITNLFITGLILFTFLPKVKFEIRMNKDIVFKLIRFGFLPSLLPFATVLFQSVDRWIFASMASKTIFGYYSLGTTIGITLAIIPQSLISPITKKLNSLIYSESSAKDGVSTMIDFMLAIIASCQALIGGVLILALPYLISRLFPQYEEGITTISILVFASILLFPISTVYEAHISLNKVKSLISTIFLFVSVEAILVYLGGHFFSLMGAAVGVALNNFCFGFSSSTKTLVLSGASFSQAVIKSVKNYSFVFLVLFLAMSLRYMADSSQHLFKTVSICCLFVLLISPIFFFFLKPKFLNREPARGDCPS